MKEDAEKSSEIVSNLMIARGLRRNFRLMVKSSASKLRLRYYYLLQLLSITERGLCPEKCMIIDPLPTHASRGTWLSCRCRDLLSNEIPCLRFKNGKKK